MYRKHMVRLLAREFGHDCEQQHQNFDIASYRQ